MLDTPSSDVVRRVLATHSTRQFPLHFPYRASPCDITFQMDSTSTLRTAGHNPCQKSNRCACARFRSKWRVPTNHPESIRTSALAHYALLEMVDIFNLCIVAEQYVAPTNSSPVIPPTASSPPHRATHAFLPAESSRGLWAVFTRSNSVRGTLPWSVRAARCSGDAPRLCSNATPSIMTEVLCGCCQSLQENISI